MIVPRAALLHVWFRMCAVVMTALISHYQWHSVVSQLFAGFMEAASHLCFLSVFPREQPLQV